MDSPADMYTPLEVAVNTARRRVGLPAPFRDDELAHQLFARPHAVLFRHVATPNFELRWFREVAIAAGLVPLVLEYHRDKFVTRNADKLALARLTFYDGVGRNGGQRLRLARIASLAESDGLPLHQVRTTWGQELNQFHHEVLGQEPCLADLPRFEGSPWFARHGGSARNYYQDLLTLFTGCSLLFETFSLMGEEEQFTRQVVQPAFAQAASVGRRPLICRAFPPLPAGEPNWSHYPVELETHVRAKLAGAAGGSHASSHQPAA